MLLRLTTVVWLSSLWATEDTKTGKKAKSLRSLDLNEPIPDSAQQWLMPTHNIIMEKTNALWTERRNVSSNRFMVDGTQYATASEAVVRLPPPTPSGGNSNGRDPEPIVDRIVSLLLRMECIYCCCIFPSRPSPSPPPAFPAIYLNGM